jgi:membrane fusion protein, multidrug efflux system
MLHSARMKGPAMRYAFTVIAILLVIGGLAGLKAAQISTLIKSGEEGAKMGPPPESVGTAKTGKADWEETIDAVGSVASAKGVTVTTEVPGTVKKIAFESGDMVKAGEVLVELESSIEQAQLASAVAELDLARMTAERSKALAERGSLAKAALDQDRAMLDAATARVAGLRAQVGKKVVRAPFSGRLGIRSIDLGQYLTPGTPIATLESIDESFVDFSVPQQRLADVKEGAPVRITLGSDDESKRSVIDGTITAIDPSVDVSTRSVQLRARVPDDKAVLRPGMFVDVAVVLPKNQPVVTAPTTAIVHAPYGDSVFVVEDKKADSPGMAKTPDGKPVKVVRQQFVRTGRQRGDFTAIVEGVKEGQELVTVGAFKLRNGAPIVVTDQAVLDPKLNPRPENR